MTKLSQVADAQSGTGFPVEYQGKQSGDYPFAKVSDISIAVETNNGVLDTARNWVSTDVAEALRASIFPPGSVLFAKIGEALKLNRRGFVQRPMLADNNVMGLLPDTAVLDPKYLYYFMQTIDLASYAQTTAVPSIRSSDVLKISIPLPPLDEQQRIAAILEEADHARRTRRYTQQVSDTFLQSVFVEMFGDPVTNPMGWEIKPLSHFIDFLTSGSRGWAKHYSETGAYFIRVQNLHGHRLSFDNMARVQVPDTIEAKRTRVRAGDLLIAVTGATIGLSALVPETLDEAYVNQHVVIVRLKETINRQYLAHFIAHDLGGQYQIWNQQYGDTRPGLGFAEVRALQIPVPPRNLQDEYVCIADEYVQARNQQSESARQAEHLFQSLLDRAFRGEL